MVLAVTSRAVASYSGAATTSFVSGSFTPSANSNLYVFTWAENAAFAYNTPTGGSLTYTSKATGGPAGGGAGRVALWEAAVGGSPSAMTVTMTTTASVFLAYAIFDVTGTSPTIVSGQAVGATQTGVQPNLTTGTLPSAATSGNMTILCCGVNNDGGVQPATPASWTGINVGTTGFESVKTAYNTAFTGTSLTFSRSAGDPTDSGTVLFEIAEGGAPAAARTKAKVYNRAAIVRASTI